MADEILAEYLTTTDDLAQALVKVPGMPLAIGVGEYKAAPCRLEQREMTPDQRADWYDKHQGEASVTVVCLRETSRGAVLSVPIDFSILGLLREIAAERRAQVDALAGLREFVLEPGELAHAAVCYALSGAEAKTIIEAAVAEFWPWDSVGYLECTAFAPHTPRQDLIRAAALILGEIERLDRAERVS